MIVLSLLVPMVAGAVAQNAPLGNLAVALNKPLHRHVDGWSAGLAVVFAATLVAAIHVVLGLVFDPRYKDFQLALFSGPVAALAIVAFLKEPVRPAAGVAKWVAAGLTQRLGAVCGLQRGNRELAGPIVCEPACCARAYRSPGHARARLSTSNATARAERRVL